MNILFYTGLEAAVAALVLLPVFWIFNRLLFGSVRRTVLLFLPALYLVAVVSLVGLPNITYVRFEPNVNLLPFRDMLAGWKATVLNVVLFVPLGFFLTVFWKDFRRLRNTVLFGFVLSLTIEVLQIFTFRATDVNDLITNSLGTGIGWLLGRLSLKLVPTLPRQNAGKELAAVFGTVAFVMFFVHPFLMNFVWTYLL